MASFEESKATDVYVIDPENGKKMRLGRIASLELTPDEDEDAIRDKVVELRESIEVNVGFNLSMASRRLLAGIISPCLASNNWRKHHSIPMWRR